MTSNNIKMWMTSNILKIKWWRNKTSCVCVCVCVGGGGGGGGVLYFGLWRATKEFGEFYCAPHVVSTTMHLNLAKQNFQHTPTAPTGPLVR